MALDLNLPTPGQKVWGAQLNGEIEKIADAVNENTEEIEGRLSDSSINEIAQEAVAPVVEIINNGRLSPAFLSTTISTVTATDMANPESALQSETLELVEGVLGGGVTGLVRVFKGALTDLGVARPNWAGVLDWFIRPGDANPTHVGPDDVISEVIAEAYPSNLIALDYFSRNPGALGLTEVGSKPWSVLGSTDGVISVEGHAARVTQGTGGSAQATVDLGVARMRFRGKITSQSSGLAQIIFRYVDPSNYFILNRAESSGTVFHYRLVKRIAGASNNIKTTTQVMLTGDEWDIDDRVSGQLKIYINGIKIYDEATDTSTAGSLNTATKAGVYTSSASNFTLSWDNLEWFGAS